MFYIHHKVCISPQITFPEVDLQNLVVSNQNRLTVQPFSVEGIPNPVLRRMGKAVKYGVAASLPIFKVYGDLSGIIIGTANGGMEDCIKFLNQIIQYEEGVLTPTNFVQSTTNAIASQLGFFSKNKGYNITHVHRGLAFENAILDADMLLLENPKNSYLLGGIDEISDYNFNIEYLSGWFKKESVIHTEFYATKTEGSIAGEGVAMFVVNNNRAGASSCFRAIQTIHTSQTETVTAALKNFITSNLLQGETIDLFISGENGDVRFLEPYEQCEVLLDKQIPIVRFKHMCGEYPTASAFAVFVADTIINTQQIPEHMLKNAFNKQPIKRVLIYNNYQGYQHSFMLVTGIDYAD